MQEWDARPSLTESFSAAQELQGQTIRHETFVESIEDCLPFLQSHGKFKTMIKRHCCPDDSFDYRDYVDLHRSYGFLGASMIKWLPQIKVYIDLSSDTAATISRICTSLISVCFLIAPMVTLTYVKPTEYVLIGASLFSAVFGLVVALVSRGAKSQEIFGIVAAYAAVLIVFVGNALQSKSS
jgi:hypothetical protein